MMRYGILLVVLFFPAWAMGAEGCFTGAGDVDGVPGTSITDVQCVAMISLFVAGGQGPYSLLDCAVDGTLADADCDGRVDVTDVELTLRYALDAPLSSGIDQDGDGCPDSCDPGPTDPGQPPGQWVLEDVQPQSPKFQTSYGVEDVNGVVVVALLASW